MFAVAINYTRTNEYFLVIDHLGQKPIYFYPYDGGIIYASSGEHLLEVGVGKAINQFETFFLKSCKFCMRSDVPYGVLLSGGIDISMWLR